MLLSDESAIKPQLELARLGLCTTAKNFAIRFLALGKTADPISQDFTINYLRLASKANTASARVRDVQTRFQCGTQYGLAIAVHRKLLNARILLNFDGAFGACLCALCFCILSRGPEHVLLGLNDAISEVFGMPLRSGDVQFVQNIVYVLHHPERSADYIFCILGLWVI